MSVPYGFRDLFYRLATFFYDGHFFQIETAQSENTKW